ncbi:hypothetical protein CCR96_21330 [Halochromatium roseum]|nr:response regulator [Halochromatium roseum]MBK5941744.1 hypothetical protein [Halochromatium roseum]
MPTIPSILVVDDQVDNLKMLFNTLKQEYRVRVANSGAEALSIVRQSAAPDLFLLDVMMPEMDGYDLCRRLKSLPGIHETPVIFLTARRRPEDEIRGFEVGAVDYVTKPVNPRLVQARIKAQLTLARQIKQARKDVRASSNLVARVIRERKDQEAKHALLAREIDERKQADVALPAQYLAHEHPAGTAERAGQQHHGADIDPNQRQQLQTDAERRQPDADLGALLDTEQSKPSLGRRPASMVKLRLIYNK